jgi:hypothetical protein
MRTSTQQSRVNKQTLQGTSQGPKEANRREDCQAIRAKKMKTEHVKERKQRKKYEAR